MESVVLAGLLASSLVWTVASADSAHHCRKIYDSSTYTTALICINVENAMELFNEMKEARDVSELLIANSTFMYFVHGTFEETKVKEIYLGNTSLLAFSDTDAAFVGLENQLNILYMYRCSYVNDLDWYQLRKLKQLVVITITQSDLVYIDDMSPLAGNSQLGAINIHHNDVSGIHPNAFSELKQVKMISLKKNKISSLKRTMFANPAKIKILDLNHNQLQNLPADMFSNMPDLRTLFLNDNQMLTISEEVFSGVFTQLSVFSLQNNPISCDCRLKWITEMQKPMLRGECSKPLSLKGRRLIDLEKLDLWC